MFLEFYRTVQGTSREQPPKFPDSQIKEFEQESSWWLATDSHGSQMANIISRLDPRCAFYIAQVTDNSRYFAEGNVVNAFQWLISEPARLPGGSSFAGRMSMPPEQPRGC
ncbi:hypothetical protein F4810DRAFT_713432 [Camillea tinctor]|nr:hypothetical protein F4810DRAFT_713432 [Camillea tinctor]